METVAFSSEWYLKYIPTANMHIKYIQKDYSSLTAWQLEITSPILKLLNKKIRIQAYNIY